MTDLTLTGWLLVYFAILITLSLFLYMAWYAFRTKKKSKKPKLDYDDAIDAVINRTYQARNGRTADGPTLTPSKPRMEQGSSRRSGEDTASGNGLSSILDD